MKKAAVLALFAALLAGGFSAAKSAERGLRVHRVGHRYAHYAHHVRHARTVYPVYRSPRYIPPPEEQEPHFFEFFPTNRVNTHMY
jgi:hypothetical protein